MRHLDKRCAKVGEPRAYLRLDFDKRQKVRMRAVATNGEIVGIHLKRGTSLKDGDCLCDEAGAVFEVKASNETLSVVRCDSPTELARAAYHLGNRHVRLQVSEGNVAYQSDHVLDEMVEQLGFRVAREDRPFEPEPGAYHRHGSNTDDSSPGHDHMHEHGLGDDHEHPHTH